MYMKIGLIPSLSLHNWFSVEQMKESTREN